MDSKGNNTVSQANFLGIINAYIAHLSLEQTMGLLEYLGIEFKNSRINYVEFLKKLQDPEDLRKGHPWLFTKYT